MTLGLNDRILTVVLLLFQGALFLGLAPANLAECAIFAIAEGIVFAILLGSSRNVQAKAFALFGLELFGALWIHHHDVSRKSLPIIVKKASKSPSTLIVTGIYINGEKLPFSHSLIKWTGPWEVDEHGFFINIGREESSIQINDPDAKGHIDVVLNRGGSDLSIPIGNVQHQFSTQAPQSIDGRIYLAGKSMGPDNLFLHVMTGLSAICLGFVLCHLRISLPILAAALFATTCFAVHWSEYPALLSPDDADQFNQCTSGKFVLWHPLLHTFLACGTRQIWNTPATLVLIQIAWATAIFHFFLRNIRFDWSKEALLFRMAVVLFSLLPLVALLLNWVGRDTVFYLAWLSVFLLVESKLRSPAPVLGRPWVFWTAESMFIAIGVLSRSNGLLFAISFAAVILVLQPRTLRFLLIPCGCAILLSVAQPLICKLVKIPVQLEFASAHALAIPIQQLAAYEVADVSFAPTDARLLSEVFNLKEARKNFDYYNYSSLLFNGSFDVAAANRNASSLVGIWLRTSLAHPGLWARSLLRAYWPLLMPFRKSNGGEFYLAPDESDSVLLWDMIGISPPFSQESLVPSVSYWMQSFRRAAVTGFSAPLVYPAFAIYLCLASLFSQALRANRGLVIGSATLLGGLLLSAPLEPFPQIRFHWGMQFWAELLILCWISQYAIEKERKVVTVHQTVEAGYE